jgi:hypothetical protein
MSTPSSEVVALDVDPVADLPSQTNDVPVDENKLPVQGLLTLMQEQLDKLKEAFPKFVMEPVPNDFEKVTEVLDELEDGLDAMNVLVDMVVTNCKGKPAWKEIEEQEECEVKVARARKPKEEKDKRFIGKKEKKYGKGKEELKGLKKRVQASERESKAIERSDKVKQKRKRNLTE